MEVVRSMDTTKIGHLVMITLTDLICLPLTHTWGAEYIESVYLYLYFVDPQFKNNIKANEKIAYFGF